MSARFSLERAAAIAHKEVWHILRDPYTLILALVFPVVTVVLYGLAIDFNIRDISLSVADADQTQSSRALLDTFSSSGYFRLRAAGSPTDAMADVQGERAKATLIIPPRFEKDLFSGQSAQAQILIDGADNATVEPVIGYATVIQGLASSRMLGNPPEMEVTGGLELRARYLFNPELNSRWFVIPGLLVVVMAILSILLTALTVAREWENGSMELLLSTPVQPIEIIIGKLTPYGVLGALAIAMTYFVARAGFGIPFEGHVWVFALGCVLFLGTYLAQGLLISVVARNQQVALQMAMVSGLLPSNLLSGFVFPIASMPVFFQWFTMILPARWFMQISRYVFLRGTSASQLWVPFTALAILCTGMIRLATGKFKRDLEP